jgi:hypothetical protein
MSNKKVNEGLADLAQRAESDHEVQMARADLYKIAKYAIKLHDMLKSVSEAEGLEGWQQAKITKASDYISSVYHNLEYDLKFGDGQDMDPSDVSEGKSPHKKGTKKYKKHMAAMHAGMKEDEYKSNLSAMLERSLTKGEEGKREKYVKGMKKAKGDFKDRYGKDAEAVMYATATKMAKKK